MNITFVSYAFSKFKYVFFFPVQKIGENEFLERKKKKYIYIYIYCESIFICNFPYLDPVKLIR